MKYKKFPLHESLDQRLKEESRLSGLTGNSIVIIALDEYLHKKENLRKKIRQTDKEK